MFGSVALDVVIGLVLVYLLYSLLATILAELIVSWLGVRARMLRQAIERMLVDRYYEDMARNWVQRLFHPVALFFLYEFKEFRKGLAGQFYSEPSIKYLARGKSGFWFFFNSTKPSCIRPENFSETLIRMMKNRGVGTSDAQKVAFCLKFNSLGIQPNTLKHISNLFSDAGGDPERFSAKLDQWYNEMMERLNGWFKQKLRTILFILGLIMAMTFNVDSISIARKLAKDKDARDQMVAMAISASDSSSALAKALAQSNDTTLNDSLLLESYRQVQQASDDAGMILGLGWDKKELSKLSAPGKVWYVLKKSFSSWQMLLGFIITALAISLGSNFWFELLGKLVSIRSAGKKPEEKSDEEKEKLHDRQKLAAPPAAAGVQVPPPFTDPVSSWVARFGEDLMKIAGVHSVFKVIQRQGDVPTAGIRVNVTDELARKEVVKKIAGIPGWVEEIPITIVVSGLPRTLQSPHKGQIANKNGLNGLGAIGCIVQHKTNGRNYILSCWHVMKGDQNLDADDPYKVIIDHEKLDIANRWAGGIAEGYDFAFARCLPGGTFDNQFLQKALGVTPGGHRPVTDQDINFQTSVRYYDAIEGTVQNGRIIALCQSMVISYPDKARYIRDILVITNDSTGQEKTISQPGNSGSILFDESGKALCMIIAGDNQYTYACRLTPIFDIFSEMQMI